MPIDDYRMEAARAGIKLSLASSVQNPHRIKCRHSVRAQARSGQFSRNESGRL